MGHLNRLQKEITVNSLSSDNHLNTKNVSEETFEPLFFKAKFQLNVCQSL